MVQAKPPAECRWGVRGQPPGPRAVRWRCQHTDGELDGLSLAASGPVAWPLAWPGLRLPGGPEWDLLLAARHSVPGLWGPQHRPPLPSAPIQGPGSPCHLEGGWAPVRIHPQPSPHSSTGDSLYPSSGRGGDRAPPAGHTCTTLCRGLGKTPSRTPQLPCPGLGCWGLQCGTARLRGCSGSGRWAGLCTCCNSRPTPPAPPPLEATNASCPS